jgi:FtsP/CotA-like multicopper oxidase with cupredoxin domain
MFNSRNYVLCWVSLFVVVLCGLLPQSARAQVNLTSTSAAAATPVALVPNPCPRFTAGSVIHQPPALFSQNGVLNVRFSYQATSDSAGRQLFCFMTPDGLQNPTLHVNPGDTLNITVTNNTPSTEIGDQTFEGDEPFGAPNCGDTTFESYIVPQGNVNPPSPFGMTGGSMNIHYHGTNTSPACHEDNVVKTLINPGSTFQYSVHFPANEPPGLYWYHPHVHMLAEAAVFGGAEGALVVDGINNVQPAVARLRHRVIIIRDQQFTDPMLNEANFGVGNAVDGGVPQRDLSVNFVPLNSSFNYTTQVMSYTPAVIHMEPGEQQFWRICNCTADAPLDLQVRFDGVPQTIQLVGIDAVPVNSQDGTQPGGLVPVTRFRIPPASRVEFLVNAPASTVKVAQLVAQYIYSGPLGDTLPTRPLLNVQLVNAPDADEPLQDDRVPAFTALNTNQQRFGGIMNVTPALTRTVYFEEFENGTAFFINASGCVTAAGAQCAIQPYGVDTAFDNNHLPAITTTQGTVEKWIVQNHARENHELHQHQIHFKVLSQDKFDDNCLTQTGTGNCNLNPPQDPCKTCAPGIDNQFLDMIEIPYCGSTLPAKNVTLPDGRTIQVACTDANGNPVIPYPQVELLMDFRGPDVGDFVFHCHILGHEDLGMMAIERVLPKKDDGEDDPRKDD